MNYYLKSSSQDFGVDIMSPFNEKDTKYFNPILLFWTQEFMCKYIALNKMAHISKNKEPIKCYHIMAY